jgi:cysteine desulfurase
MRIYLDHNATTPVRDAVTDALLRALRECWGNPSSVHAEGAAARACVEQARERVATRLGVAPRDVVFCSGASEANNTLLLRIAGSPAAPGRHVVTSHVEHPSIEAPLAALEATGLRVTRVPVDREGRLDPDAVAAAVAPDTALVSVLYANNETGVIQPLAEIAERVHARGVRLHADVTQAPGRLPLDLARLGVDFASLSAHKFGGPKGTGCLIARGGAAFEPWLRGGGQERGLRGGTENVPGILGLAAALELAQDEQPEHAARLSELRNRLVDGILAKVPRVRRNGSTTHVLPNTANLCFEGVAGEVLLQALDLEGVAVSAGAACASGKVAPSRGLLALGLSPADARASLRFSLGHGNDEAQIDRAIGLLPDLVARARAAAGA